MILPNGKKPPNIFASALEFSTLSRIGVKAVGELTGSFRSTSFFHAEVWVLASEDFLLKWGGDKIDLYGHWKISLY